MSTIRLARLSMLLAAIGLNAAPALLQSAHAQDKPAAAAAAVPPKDTVRPDMFKLVDPAVISPLMTAKKYAEVEQRLTQAEAMADKTAFEQFILHRMRASLGAGTNNDAMTIKSLEAIVESKRLVEKEQSGFINAIASMYYNQKNYAKAIQWGERYQKESSTPLAIRSFLVRAYYFNKDYPNTLATLRPIIAESKAANKAPDTDDARLYLSSAQLVKDAAATQDAMDLMLAYYPSDDHWHDALNRVMMKPTFNKRLPLDVYRLKVAAQKSIEKEDYVELAELALLAGFWAEAKAVVDAGYTAGVLGSGPDAAKHKSLRERANKGAADDAKNMGAGEAPATKAKDGLPLVNLGYAYVTMGEFDKGLDLMQKGIAKGGLKRPDEATLHLGVAYAKAGRKAEAIKVFEGLNTKDGMDDLGRYWIMHLNAPVAVAAAPAPK
ncbi:MAG: hypothetical protein V4857_13870 [Pseudomonadota bacterium]